MKNILLVGPGRNGKTTLARRINEELGYFVCSLDKLMTAFDKAFPQLDIRIAWDYKKATANIAPFLGHYLGMLTAGDGYAGDLNLRTHAIPGNRFVVEGGHFDFDKISAILKTYGIETLADHFILIGLVQNGKTPEEFFRDLRTYDTADEWTYDMTDEELMAFSEMSVAFNGEMTAYLRKYGFTIYDTSFDRERVFDRIIDDIRRSNESQ
jgi:hypothetical protein